MADAVVAGGLHRVETVMGIPVGVDVRDDGVDPARSTARSPICARSTRRSARTARTSDVRRLDRGRRSRWPTRGPRSARCSRAASACARATGGWFDVRATGRLDPSGFVKGWAVDGAVAILRAAGARNLCVHAGGDVRVLGERARPAWRVGVQHPRERDRVAAVLDAPPTARGRDVRRVRARRAHRRPAHGRAAARRRCRSRSPGRTSAPPTPTRPPRSRWARTGRRGRRRCAATTR